MMKFPKKLRFWGMNSDKGLLHQPITLEDITGIKMNMTGADSFIESLGDKAQDFQDSMMSQDMDIVMRAEKNIAASSPLMQSPGGGGIFHYRNHYPADGYLHLWTGLVLEVMANYSQAVPEFLSAINLGCNNWRVAWYLAQAAEKGGNCSLAKEAVAAVIKVNPGFQDALVLHDRLHGYASSISTEARETNPDRQITLQLDMVRELFRKGNDHEAKSSLEKAIADFPESAEFLNYQVALNYRLIESRLRIFLYFLICSKNLLKLLGYRELRMSFVIFPFISNMRISMYS